MKNKNIFFATALCMYICEIKINLVRNNTLFASIFSFSAGKIRQRRLIHTIKFSQKKVQGDRLYMAACFWYLVKSNLSSVRVYSREHISNYLQSARKTRPCLSGQVVQKVSHRMLRCDGDFFLVSLKWSFRDEYNILDQLPRRT